MIARALRLARRMAIGACLLLAGLALASALWVLAYRWIDPPTTPSRLVQALGGTQVNARWVPLEDMSPLLVLGAVVAEDRLFCLHNGFDTQAIRAAVRVNRAGGPLVGASTISQQTARTVFLWQQRSWFRKGMEAWFTFLIELFWSKSRIVEVYLNSAEWGPGVYGVGAATHAYFGPVQRTVALNYEQAADLIARLPAPVRLAKGLDEAAIERKWNVQSLIQLPNILQLVPCLGKQPVL